MVCHQHLLSQHFGWKTVSLLLNKQGQSQIIDSLSPAQVTQHLPPRAELGGDPFPHVWGSGVGPEWGANS